MRRDLLEAIRCALFDLGIPPNLLVFKYIELAILICIEDEDDHNGHLKRLYDEISKIYETSPARWRGVSETPYPCAGCRRRTRPLIIFSLT